MNAGTLLTPELLAFIGKPMWDAETVQVREADILRYQEALGDGMIVRDADGVLRAPPLFLPAFHHGGVIGNDGRRRKPGEFDLPVPVKRRLMAGCSVDFGVPIRAGDTITATTVIESLTEKNGASGPMLLVVTATDYRNQRGECNRIERWTVIRR
jgi:hypothetical protein